MGKTAFTLGGSKEASLYFDSVVPLCLVIDAVEEYGWDEFLAASGPNEVLPKLAEIRSLYDFLMPPQVKKGSPHFESWVEVGVKILKSMLESEKEHYSGKANVPLADIFATSLPQVKDDIVELIDSLGIDDAAFSSELAFASSSSDPNDDIGITLRDLNLIDTSKTSLEQIVKFREDKESIAKLRRLRLFAYQNYSGKSRSYIEDDLQLRIDEYEKEVKKWGFNTRHAAFTTLLNSKVLLGAVGGSIFAAIAGSPITSLSTITIGSMVELGRVHLAITREKFAAREALRENPVSYIKIAKSEFNT
jgi:hypothetical protein